MRRSTLISLGALAAGLWANPAEAAICDEPSVDLDSVGDVEVQAWAQAVGRLKLISGSGFCTATLVAPNLAITAGHCFDGGEFSAFAGKTLQQMCDMTTMQFGYENVGGVLQTGGAQFDCVEVVDQEFISFPTSGALDVTLLRLEGNPGFDFGFLPYDTGFDFEAENSELTIIHHQDAGPKRVSTTDEYFTQSFGGVFLRHRASTQGGSSGAAILSDDGKVVAVHSGTVDTFGTCDDDNLAYPTLRLREEAQADPSFEAIGGVQWAGNSSGPTQSDRFGGALATGDFNGDGADDLAIHHNGDANAAGRVTIYFGTLGEGLDTDGPIILQQSGISTPESNDRFGSALATADFNGDGFDELVVGTPEEHWGSIANSGIVAIYSGGPAGLVLARSLRSENWNVPSEANMEFGRALATGDFDCDGDVDLAIGGPGTDDALGRVYFAPTLVNGLPHALDSFNAIELGVDQSAGPHWFGYSLASGHLAGWPPQGVPASLVACHDLAIGAPLETSAGLAASGMVAVIIGDEDFHSDPSVELRLPPEPAGFALFGASLSTGNMFDAVYGYDTLAVGSPFHDAARGRVDAFRGWLSLDTDAYSLTTDDAQAVVDPGTWDQFGYASVFAATAGPTARAQLIIAAPWYDQPGENDAGFTLGFRAGPSGTGLEAVPVLDPHGKTLDSGDAYGTALASGDFDGDGVVEIVIGVPHADEDGVNSSGGVLIRHVSI